MPATFNDLRDLSLANEFGGRLVMKFSLMYQVDTILIQKYENELLLVLKSNSSVRAVNISAGRDVMLLKLR